VAVYRLQLAHCRTTVRAATPQQALARLRKRGWTTLGRPIPPWRDWRQTAPGQWAAGAGIYGAVLDLDLSSLPLD
jgi:hypothetical protein